MLPAEYLAQMRGGFKTGVLVVLMINTPIALVRIYLVTLLLKRSSSGRLWQLFYSALTFFPFYSMAGVWWREEFWVGALTALLNGVAIFLLFTGTSRQWFAKQKAEP